MGTGQNCPMPDATPARKPLSAPQKALHKLGLVRDIEHSNHRERLLDWYRERTPRHDDERAGWRLERSLRRLRELDRIGEYLERLDDDIRQANRRALAFLDQETANTTATPIEHLKAVARWTMEVQLAGEMPSLPAQNSSLRAALVADMDYMGQLIAVSERLGAWITEAQSAGGLSTAVPAEVVLYSGDRVLRGEVESIGRAIHDQSLEGSQGLLLDVKPNVPWVRLAQRVPVRIRLLDVPPELALIAGTTCTITIGE